MPVADDGLWEQHLPAFQAFLAVCSQWNVVGVGMGGVIYIGLDYSAASVSLDRAGIETSPSIWRDLQDIEQGALEGLNRRHS